MSVGAYVPFRSGDELDERLADLTAERAAFMTASARDGAGVRSPKRVVRARATANAQRELERYNATCREVDRLSALQHERTDQFLAAWMRTRPPAARQLMRLLPPAATVRTTQPTADLATGTLCSVVYYADDGSAIGVIRTPIGAPEGPGKHELLDLPRHTRMVSPTDVELVPVLTRLTPERVTELLQR